ACEPKHPATDDIHGQHKSHHPTHLITLTRSRETRREISRSALQNDKWDRPKAVRCEATRKNLDCVRTHAQPQTGRATHRFSCAVLHFDPLRSGSITPSRRCNTMVRGRCSGSWPTGFRRLLAP